MITVITWVAIICYTSTNASCHALQNIPDVAGCTEVWNEMKKKVSTARLAQCFSMRTLVVSQSGSMPPLPAGVEYLTTGPAR